MTFDLALNETLHVLLDKKQADEVKADQIIACLDLTLLDESITDKAILDLDKQAAQNETAAVCILGIHLPLLKNTQAHYRLATVVNFPNGNNSIRSCIKEIEQAVAQGAKEIDYVFPYQKYLAGQQQVAIDHCASIVKTCKTTGVDLKVILETGAFPDVITLYKLCQQILPLGPNFLKTSTGKIAQGASLSAAFALLSTIKDSEHNCGIKVSGGIKNTTQAYTFANLAQIMLKKPIHPTWFRIGASSLLDALLKS